MIYLDHAATSFPKPPEVIDAVTRALETFGSPGRGAHAAMMTAARTVHRARAAVADVLGGRADRVVFTHNATYAINMALEGLLLPGDHVIATDLDHNAVLRPLYRLRERGVECSFLEADAEGRVDPHALDHLRRPNTRAVVTTHASNVLGTLLDIDVIAQFCRAHDLWFILDAAQTAGTIPIDIEAMHIDVLCFTGHKGLLGPQGTGGLIVRDRALPMRPFAVGGSGFMSFSETMPPDLPARMEAGTQNAHGLAGLAAGIDYLKRHGIERLNERSLRLADRFRDAMTDIPGIRLYGDATRPHVPIVALNIGDIDAGAVADALDRTYGICVRAGAHCAPRVHRALGTEHQGAVRFSFGHTNTDDDVDRAVHAMRELAQTFDTSHA